METIVITNFNGSMTQYLTGELNSGFSNVNETFGNDPFAKPGSLTWSVNSEEIDPDGLVITDLIMDGKERIESGILYVYAIGHTGRLYKIQVNDPTTYNPNFDNPVLLTTITINSPTFTRGGFMDFFGSTEKIYIGHDQGVTSVNFDGSGEAFVGVLGSWTQDVPRPFDQFLGKLYVGNGENLAEIDSTATVTTYSKLSPSFPAGTQVRDIDVTPDGNYLQSVVSRMPLGDQTSPNQDTSIIANADSYIFKWNGTDLGYTSFDTFPSSTLVSNLMFGNNQFTFGYDARGVAIFNPVERIISSNQNSSFEQAPAPNAVTSDGNLATWMATLFFFDHVELSYCIWGTFDFEIGLGYWSPFGMVATEPETDIVRIPFQKTVSNFGRGISSNGYPNNIFGTSKIYFSTLETSAAPSIAYRFYKWSPLSGGLGTPMIEAVYQTQQQQFGKKVWVKQVRIYGEPWASGVSFQFDLIGSDGNPIAGTTKVFTAGSTLTVGNDFAWFDPAMAPVYGFGIRFTNLGETNHTIIKVEVDVMPAGK